MNDDGTEQAVGQCVVGIITRDRPGPLARCVEALLGELRAGDRIVVVDNGDAPCGLESTGPLEILRSEPGYSTARNVVLDAVGSAEFLIYVDDDQVVRAGWLRRMLDTATRHPGMAVTGYRTFVLPTQAKDPALLAAVSQMNELPAAGISTQVATGNTLVPIHGWRKAGCPRFRTEFAKVGGEDVDFFRRLAAGGTPTWSQPDILVDEHVLESRVTRAWLADMAYRAGRSRALMGILASGSRGRAIALVGGLARVAVGLPGALGTSVHRRDIWPQDFYKVLSGAGFIRQSLTRQGGR